ncbi:MAG: flagellar biosynthesis anti-sigma factor FlgM [Proteobacteria bacterium]|jgi:flagellar biosynthesis anti-sigma factor FlgM|nr:flagellar biosynthesis anti-sigma factor FlgM [Pseudomonadota bacterium]
MAAGRIGSNPPPTLSPAAMPKGEAGERIKDSGPAPGAAGLAALAGNPALEVGGEPSGPSGPSGPGIAGPDFGVQISQSGKSRIEAHKKALNIARNTPDVREDKVAEFKKRIADGNYQVDSGKIADGIMHEAIREHLAESEK